MKLEDKRLIECIPASPGTSFDFKGVYTDTKGVAHNVTVFDTDYFILHVIQLFRNRRIMIDTETPDYLAGLFASWRASRENLYLKQAYAYTLKYNPIENYASHEVLSDDVTETEHGEVIEHEHGHEIETTPSDYKDETTYPTERKTETTPYNTTETTTPTADTTTHSTKGFNSSEFVETDRDVRSGSVSVTTTHPEITKETVSETVTGTESTERTYDNHEIIENRGTDTDTHSGKDTVTHSYTLDKTGNIGVQTASQMLEMEYEGLKQDLAYRALTEFIDRYTFYSEPID